MSLNNFNFRTGCWEPLIEPTAMEANLTRSFGAYEMKISCAEPIQVNLSLLALKMLLQTVTDIQLHVAEEENGGSTGNKDAEAGVDMLLPPEPHLTWIENHLGIDINIEIDDNANPMITLEGRDWRKDSIIQTNKTVSDADRAIQDALSLATQFDDTGKIETSSTKIRKASTNADVQNRACIDVKFKTVNLHIKTYKTLQGLPVYTNTPKAFFLHCDETDKANELALKNDSQTVRSVRMFIWDSSFDNGRRLIVLRSPIAFRNTLPYPVLLRVTTTTEQPSVVELGPIKENCSLYLPLMSM